MSVHAPSAPVPPLLLKPPDAAKALAMSERTLWDLTDRGEIPCVRFRRSVRYDLADLQAWIAKVKVKENGNGQRK